MYAMNWKVMSKVTLTADQLKRAEAMRWYHAIDFGEYQARGRNRPPYPPNMTRFSWSAVKVTLLITFQFIAYI